MKWFYGLYPTDRIKIKNKYYYISNFFPKINILFSIWPLISTNLNFYHKIKKKSFREVFSISNDTEVIADSGSFSYYRLNSNYKAEWNLKKILNMYDTLRPDFAVHNDIPISFLKKSNNFNRIKLLKKNLLNAKMFLKKSEFKQYEPIGVAQGIEETDYLKQLSELYHFGYDYIGIGGVSYQGAKRIDSILTAVFKFIKNENFKIKLHIFGVGRIEVLKKYKIYSFDNTSPLNDSHRDKIGKRTYYYVLDKGKSKIIKKSLFHLQKQNYIVNCDCPLCNLISTEILKTGSALRNHSRAFHNAYVYQKCLNNLIL